MFLVRIDGQDFDAAMVEIVDEDMHVITFSEDVVAIEEPGGCVQTHPSFYETEEFFVGILEQTKQPDWWEEWDTQRLAEVSDPE